MDWYYYIALAAILSQLVFLIQMYRNYRYALAKYKRKRPFYRPRTALFVPCKDLDSAFQKNITSFFNQDYEHYLLWFVVADKSDPAYDELCKLKSRLSQSSKAQDVQVFVAGPVRNSTSGQQPPKGKASNGAGQGQSCSQKIHNLLYCYERIGDDVEVLAFADSDISVRSDWLSHIVWPLRKSKNGAASGYRWFIPKKNNLASLALSAMNAKIAQLLGNTRFNQVWGGSMAIRVDVFRQVGIDKIWPKTLSDDLSLSLAVKKAGKKVVFVPACLVASYESTNWRRLLEFGRRQFLITRINAPRTWWFGLCSSLFSILGLWGAAALAVYAAMIGEKNLPLFAAVPILFFASQLSQAILRQKMISKLLKYDLPQMKAARAADILFFWVWSLLLLFFIISSAFGRTIRWRGIRYKLLGPTETIVVGD
jgi:cellulose synthase/poly-beta-1,6-N-acetylglucosamine synthase-like glycosyltransferase